MATAAITITYYYWPCWLSLKSKNFDTTRCFLQALKRGKYLFSLFENFRNRFCLCCSSKSEGRFLLGVYSTSLDLSRSIRTKSSQGFPWIVKRIMRSEGNTLFLDIPYAIWNGYMWIVGWRNTHKTTASSSSSSSSASSSLTLSSLTSSAASAASSSSSSLLVTVLYQVLTV